MSNRVEGGLGTEREWKTRITGEQDRHVRDWSAGRNVPRALTKDDLQVATYLNLQYGGGAGVVDGMAGQV